MSEYIRMSGMYLPQVIKAHLNVLGVLYCIVGWLGYLYISKLEDIG